MSPLPLACFFCGLDSWAFLIFLICVFGVAQLGTALFLAWSIARGDFRDTEHVKHVVLEAERSR
jgi:VIT1/CCC1 family predicted Fe2+/Mn2+ transporter